MIAAFSGGELFRNTLAAMLGQALRIAIYSVYFVLIARILGPDGYGAWMSVSAFVSVVAPFASWGSGYLLIKHVARDQQRYAESLGWALLVTTIGGSALLGVVLLIFPLIAPASISPLLVLPIALADLLFAPVIELCAQAYQAFGRLARTALLRAGIDLLRLIAALILGLFVTAPDAWDWSVLWLLSAVCAALGAFWLTQRELGMPRPRLVRDSAELREGFYFAISLAAYTSANDLDKTLLARYATLNATGVYAVAYRIINVVYVPVRAVFDAAFSRFFQHGAYGIRGSTRLALRLLPWAGVYSCGAGIALWLCAPLAPIVLGAGYEYVGDVVRWLTPLLVLRTAHHFAADTLTGADYQGVRSAVQIGMACLNGALNIALIPSYGWRGAVWASIATDGLMALMLWGMVWRLHLQTPKTATVE